MLSKIVSCQSPSGERKHNYGNLINDLSIISDRPAISKEPLKIAKYCLVFIQLRSEHIIILGEDVYSLIELKPTILLYIKSSWTIELLLTA